MAIKDPRNKVDDRDLVRKAQRGDKAAFDALFYLHIGPITNFIYRYFTNIDDIEDMVKEPIIVDVVDTYGDSGNNETVKKLLNDIEKVKKYKKKTYKKKTQNNRKSIKKWKHKRKYK